MFFGGRGREGGLLCDLIDWFFGFLVFFERDEKCVVGLAGWRAVFVAWPIGISDRILQSC